MMTTTTRLTFRVMGQDEQVDAGRSSARAENGDPLVVASKMADVFVEPAQSLDLIQQAVVPFSCLIAGAQETCTRAKTRS